MSQTGKFQERRRPVGRAAGLDEAGRHARSRRATGSAGRTRLHGRALASGLVVSLVLSACAAAKAASDQLAEQVGLVAPSPTTTEAQAAATDAPTPTEGSTAREDQPPMLAEREFSTDFSVHSVDYSEILSGGPPKDGIPAIDEPQYETVDQADEWLEPNEPVILFEHAGEARAYPLQVLTWHEIANDVVGGRPVTITFCPLCNTAIAFDRTVDGQVLDFGTTGRLRFSNLIMYDRQTETWWQQASGEAIAGELTGTQLEFLPAPIIAWQEFRQSHGSGTVLSRETGYSRPYGRNPYAGYDDVRNSPFLYVGPRTPDQLRPMARVLTLELNDDVVAFPYEILEEVQVVNEDVGGEEIVVFWQPGTASALDTSALAEGRDVGSAAAYSRSVDGRTLTFEYDGSAIVDQQTGTQWDILGRAVEGELRGGKLEPVVAVDHFWFSWAAFKPETRVYQP